MNDTMKIGNAFDGDHVNFGPLVNKRQFDTVMEFIRIGKEEEKLKCVLGGNRWGDKGYFVEPTIFTNVCGNSKLA